MEYGRMGASGFFLVSPPPPPHLWHGSHGWTQNSRELSREAADQAINAESTKRRAVGENRSPFLLPEVFVFMVHYVYCVQTCSCPLIRSAHSEVTDHEYTGSPFYYVEPFYGARRLKGYQISRQLAVSLLPPTRSASSAAVNGSSFNLQAGAFFHISEWQSTIKLL